jgi:hypothetical protein
MTGTRRAFRFACAQLRLVKVLSRLAQSRIEARYAQCPYGQYEQAIAVSDLKQAAEHGI